MRRNFGSGGGSSTIEPDAGSSRRSVGGYLSGVRSEIGCWVFGGYAALQGKTVHGDLFLG